MENEIRSNNSLGINRLCRIHYCASIATVILLGSLISCCADFLYVSETSANIVRKYDLNTGADLGVFASAGLAGPEGLAFDSFGNLFVANIINGTVSKITPDGVRSTFAVAPFPNDLAIDSANNVYTSDPYGGSIRRFSPSGAGSMFAYFGTLGFPIGLAFDAHGNLYGGHGSGLIAKYSSDGSVASYISGTGGWGLAFDADGNLFSSDLSADTIGKVSPEGVVSIFATGLSGPYGLAFDSVGYLYVAETDSKTIRRFAPDGSSSVFATLSQTPNFIAIQIVPEPAASTTFIIGLASFIFLRCRKFKTT